MLRASSAAWLVVFALFSLAHSQVTTSQYDNARTGANSKETILRPERVNDKQFGKLFSFKVDGPIYAQPLYLPSVESPGKGTHNVIYVATEHDSVYAFDADGQVKEPLWKVSFLTNSDVTPVPARDVACPFIEPEVGITSTPVIDLQTGTLYVLARTKQHQGLLRDRYWQSLHALAITTGVEKFGGPVVIHASVPGRAPDASKGQVVFNSLRENPRAALLLVNDTVYLSWASSCDVDPYHGWLIAYDAHSLEPIAVFNTSPDTDASGIWAGDTGPAADQDGNVFVATGNGIFNAASKGRDYGDTLLKLRLSGHSLVVADYFTPRNQQDLNANDNDLGSGGPVLFPDKPDGKANRVLLAGKGGVIYLLDAARLGKDQRVTNIDPLQTIPLRDSAFGAPAYWNRHIFSLVSNDVLKDYSFENGRLRLVAEAGLKFIDPGATPTVSSNGKKGGIVWVLSSRGWDSTDIPAVLHAYDAANVAHELWNSEQNSSRDRAGLTTRFSIPTVVNGKVYIGTRGELDVYGLLRPVRGR